MSNKVTGFFFVFIGCIVVGIYISDLYGWTDQAEWFVISSDYISRLYEYVKDYIPIFLLLLGLFVLIRMIILSLAIEKMYMFVGRDVRTYKIMAYEEEEKSTFTILNSYKQSKDCFLAFLIFFTIFATPSSNFI